MARVSILFPVYNSISRNGDGFLQQAIDSLLKQTFADFELYILDNISTDKTPDICREFAKKDKRIKFQIDTQQRFPEEGINKLAENINTEYVMIANCDDLWDYHYIENLIKILDTNQSISLAYSNGAYIDIENITGNPLIRNPEFIYNKDINYNFCLSIQFRNVVPLLYGLFRSEVYKTILPYKAFDNLKANVDNLFLAKFFLAGYKAQICNKQLFYYRNRSRALESEKIKGMPKNPILIWVYYLRHQLHFYKAVSHYIPKDNILLKLATLDSCLRTSARLLGWARTDFSHDKFEDSIFEILYTKYLNVYYLLWKEGYPPLTRELCVDSYKKCDVLLNSVLAYIKRIMNSHEVIDTTILIVEEIQKEMKKILNRFPYNDRIAINE